MALLALYLVYLVLPSHSQTENANLQPRNTSCVCVCKFHSHARLRRSSHRVLARTLFSALDREAAVLEVATLQSVRPVTEFARAWVAAFQ